MPSRAATRRASSTASSVQQPCIALGAPKALDRCQICMVMPTTSKPWRCRRAAVTELSTPPLMPTRTDFVDISPVYERLAGALEAAGSLGVVFGPAEHPHPERDRYQPDDRQRDQVVGQRYRAGVRQQRVADPGQDVGCRRDV